MRVVLDPDEVSARSRRVEGHRRDVRILRDRRAHTVTIGVKHIAPIGKGEEGGKVAGRDRLRDYKDVVAGGHRHLHPVEEHTGGDVVLDVPAADAVIQVEEGIGRAVPEL